MKQSWFHAVWRILKKPRSGIITASFLKAARISIVFILLGITANIYATRMNGGVMPVAAIYVTKHISLDEEHVLTGPDTQSHFFVDWIAFKTPHNIPVPLTHLAELVHFPPPGHYVIASPGDVLMWMFCAIGFIGATILFCYFCISFLREMLCSGYT